MNMKKITAAILSAGMAIEMMIPAFAAQTTFTDDLSANCGYRSGDEIDTEVTNFLAVAQIYNPKGTILSWNNPDDADAEEIHLYKNGEEIENEWILEKGAFNKIGVDAFERSDVFTLTLKKNGAEKAYTAPKMSQSVSTGDWRFSIRDGWKSNTEPTNTYANGAAYVDSSEGYQSEHSLKFTSNKFQPLKSGSNPDHSENVSNDACLYAEWSIPANQGKLVAGETYQLRYMVKTHNADRLHVWCNDGDRWNGAAGNQHIARNGDWTEKTKNFVKTDNISSFTFSVAQKSDGIWIDNVRIGTYDAETDTFTPLIEETFEPNPNDYEPVNFFMAPGTQGVNSISWINPNVQNLTNISLYQVTESGETLIGDQYDTTGGLRQVYELSTSIICAKIVFTFDDQSTIQMYAAIDNNTLWGDSIPEWNFGLNQQGDFPYNPAKFVVDPDENAGEPGTASAKFVSNHTRSIDKTFVTAMQKGLEMEEGKTYAISYWVKADGNADNLKSTVSWSALYDGYTSDVIEGTSGSYDWKKLSFTYTSPDTAKKHIGFTIPYATKGFWIDNVEAYELDENGDPTGENLITNGDVSDYEIPSGKPDKVNAVGGNRNITISWANTSGYQSVWAYEKKGDQWFYRGSIPNSLYRIQFTNLEREKEYTYKIVPVSKYGVHGEEQIVTAKTLTLDYELTEPALDGETLRRGTNTISISIKNNKLETPLPVELMAAVYKDGILEQVVSEKADIAKSDPTAAPRTLSVSFELGENGEYSVRTFVLDGRNTLNSYCDMHTFY